MAIRPEDEFIEHTPADASYPEGSFKTETSPGALDGSPLAIEWGNDLLGILQKLLAVAGITPSGNPDTVLASDYFDAMNEIFQRFSVYDDTGAADVYALDSVSDAEIDAYFDGHQVTFKAANTNTGASTLEIASLGAKSFTLPDGTALPPGKIVTGTYYNAIYRLSADRYEVTNAKSGVLTKVVEIGDWDMDATANVIIPHGIDNTVEWKIRNVSVVVRDDLNSNLDMFAGDRNVNAGLAGSITGITGANVQLNRRTGGGFDSVSYDSTSYNRGWITIQYID